MKNYDKSLIEVWKWKEEVYQDVKDLTTDEYITKIRTDTDKILSENAIRLKTWKDNRDRVLKGGGKR